MVEPGFKYLSHSKTQVWTSPVTISVLSIIAIPILGLRKLISHDVSGSSDSVSVRFKGSSEGLVIRG